MLPTENTPDLVNNGLVEEHPHYFSIRDYVLTARSKHLETNWPFCQQYLQLCLKNCSKVPLPPFEPPDLVRKQYRRKGVRSDGLDALVVGEQDKSFQPLDQLLLGFSGSARSRLSKGKFTIDLGDEKLRIPSGPSTPNEGNNALKISTRVRSKRNFASVNQIISSVNKTNSFFEGSLELGVVGPDNLCGLLDRKCRSIAELGIISCPSLIENILSKSNSATEPMSSKVCPVCKAFSSTSNTTLNAHMDRCLSVESTAVKPISKRVVRRPINHKVKQQKKRSMVDIYSTALHCTLEDLDRRNGSNWAELRLLKPNGVVCDQNKRPILPQVDIADNDGESMSNFYSNGAKIQILLKFSDALTQTEGEVCNSSKDMMGNLEGESIFINKKRPLESNELCSLELSESVICGAPKEKLLVDNHEKEGSLFQPLEVHDQRKSSESRTLKKWVCSKRTTLPKKFNEKFSHTDGEERSLTLLENNSSLMTEGTSSMADGCVVGEMSSNVEDEGQDRCDSNEIFGAGSSSHEKMHWTSESDCSKNFARSETGAIDEMSPSRSNMIEASPEGEAVVTSEIGTAEVGNCFDQFPSRDVLPFQSDREESAAEDVQVNVDTVITPAENAVGDPVTSLREILSSEDQVTEQLESFPSLEENHRGPEEQPEVTASRWCINQQTHCANEIGNEAISRNTQTVEEADSKGEGKDFLSESQSMEHGTASEDMGFKFLAKNPSKTSNKLLLAPDRCKPVDLSPSRSPLPAILSNSPSHRERSDLKNVELGSSLGSPSFWDKLKLSFPEGTAEPSGGDTTQLSPRCVLPTESSIWGAERTNLDRENQTATLSAKRPANFAAAPLLRVKEKLATFNSNLGPEIFSLSTCLSSRAIELVIPFSEPITLTKFPNCSVGLASLPSQTRPQPKPSTVIRLMGQNLVVKNEKDEAAQFEFLPLGGAPDNRSTLPGDPSQLHRFDAGFPNCDTMVSQTASQPPRIDVQTQPPNSRPNTQFAYNAGGMAAPHSPCQSTRSLSGFRAANLEREVIVIDDESPEVNANSNDIGGTNMVTSRVSHSTLGSMVPQRVFNSNLLQGNMYPRFRPVNALPSSEFPDTPKPSYQMSCPGASATSMQQGGTLEGSRGLRSPFIFLPPSAGH